MGNQKKSSIVEFALQEYLGKNVELEIRIKNGEN